MADIKDVLSDILKTMDSVDGLKKSLDDLSKLKVDAGVDLKSIRNVEKLQTAIKSLAKAREALAKAEEEEMAVRKAGNEVSEAQKQKYDDAEAAVKKYEKAIVTSAVSQKNAIDSLNKKALEEKELIMERWKQNTLLGKSYGAVTGKVAQFAAGITAGTLALKAIGRFTDAARLRNDMMIASYRKLDDSLGTAFSGTLDFEKAMRQAETAAIRYGMANENVADMMVRYQRIVGETTPEALGALTEATLAMAKVMGITGAQALDYVQARMDNFGGTAASALKSLDDLREGTVKYNTTLEGVRIRGDDVIRTIQDITNSNGVYAVDQRFLSQVLMRTSAQLQSQGESYNFAQKQAENYSKALTSEAPEWMQITNAFDITKDVMNNVKTGADGVKRLTETYAAELDKAKPGLSKKVQDLLNAGYSQYDVTRLLGETLKDTEIGMKSMSKKIVELGKSSISTLASVYGKTYTEAEVMYQTALKQNKLEEQKMRLVGGTAEQQKSANAEVAAALGLNVKTVEESRKHNGQYEKLLDMYADKQAMDEIAANNIKRQDEAANKVIAVKREIASLESLISEQEKNGNKEAANLSKKKLEDLQEELDKVEAIKTKDNVGSKTILGSITEKVNEFQEATGMLTGDWFKAKFNEFASPQVLAIGAVTALLWKGFGVSKKIQETLEKKIYSKLAGIEKNTGGGGSGGGDDYGGGGGGRRGRKRAKNIRMGRGAGASRMGRMKGAAKGLLGKTKSFFKGGKGLKGLFKGSKGLLKKIPGLGLGLAALDAGDAYASGGSKGVTKSLIGSGAGALGSVAGAALGSIVPGLGTVIGGVVGGYVGDALGGVAANMYDKFTSDPKQIQTKLAPQTAAVIAPQAKPGDQQQQTGGMAGLGGDLGKLNPDGSITLTINNFMDAFAQSMSMAKQNGIKA